MQRTLTDVENNAVRHWSVQDVLLWLQHTSNGMFEEYCPIFSENHVHGEALLSLNNEILRDEFEIKKYGKRFELLKGIRKLSQMASKGALSKNAAQISQTYHRHMAPHSSKAQEMISDDNWENLDVIASNTNILNAAECTAVMSAVVEEVTGTEISQQTREKHSFYRKLSNLTQQNPVSRSGSGGVRGGYEFDANMPDWDNISIRKVLRHSWDDAKHAWNSKVSYVKIAPLPFGRGSLRMSYYCLNLGENADDICGKKLSKQQSRHRKLQTFENMDEQLLFNKLIGNKNVFGGKLCVAKKNFGLCDSVEAYFYDVRTQCESQKYAKLYNAHCPPKKVAFLQAAVIEVMDDSVSALDCFYCLESFLHGSYLKHLDNHGGDEKNRNTPSALAHFSYECSDKRLLVCDIQGVGDLYTDPQIHTYHGKGYGMGNLGNDGIIKFFQTHECNAICKHFKFASTRSLGMSGIDLIYGTRPDRQYMKPRRIDVCDTVYIDDEHYLFKIPELYHKNLKINIVAHTNININVVNNNNHNVREEREKLLDGNNDGEAQPVGDDCCCRCVVL